jgi:hypothetical protein
MILPPRSLLTKKLAPLLSIVLRLLEQGGIRLDHFKPKQSTQVLELEFKNLSARAFS